MRHRKHNKKRNPRNIPLGHTNKPVGYCRLHRCVMSRRQMNVKQCEERHCGHLYPYRDPMLRAAERAKQQESEEI